MESARFKALAEIFERACSLPPAERAAVLDELCADDVELRQEAEILLERHDAAESAGEDSLLRAADEAWRDVGSSHGSATPPASGPEAVPDRIGRYRVTGEIARGGVGIVFRGADEQIGRDVALKILRRGADRDSRLARRLLEEGRIGGRLQHPSIVPVYELGETDRGAPYVAMKVVEGRTLAELLRARSGPDQDRARFLAIFEQVCQAIAFAHSRGVIHRDLKPHNLMVGSFGEVQVMDWGLAKALGEVIASDEAERAEAGDGLADEPTHALSLAGSVLGTPAYMAPEQARGEVDRLDARTDVFGLGAILCEILTGAPPYEGRSTGELLRKARDAKLDEAVARLRATDADPEVVRIAERCLATHPAMRPANAQVVAEEVRKHFDTAAERARRAELTAAAERARAAGERKARKITTAFGGFVILALLAGGGAWLLLDQAARERSRSAQARVRASLVEAERLAAAADAAPRRDLAAWEAALVAARSARASAAEALAGTDLQTEADDTASRLEGRLRELRFLEELDRIATDYRFIDELDRSIQATAYRSAFESYLGSPLDELSDDDVVAAVARSEFRVGIVLAMDMWSMVEREVDRQSPAARRVLRIAERLDDDSWRRQIRRAAAVRDGPGLRALAMQPEADRASASTTYLLALHLATTGEEPTALELLHENYHRFPDDYWINHTLAMIHLDHTVDRDAMEAMRFATAARALRPESPAPLSYLAACYSKRSDHERALEYSRMADEASGGAMSYRFFVGYSLFRLGRYEEALEILEDCAERCPPRHDFYPLCVAWVGNARLYLGDAEGAFETYRTAVRSPFSRRSDPSWSLSDPAVHETALTAARAAVTRNQGSDPVDLYLLGRLLKDLGRWREALEVFDELLALDPDFRFGRAIMEETRRALGGEFATYSSIDEAVDALAGNAITSAALERLSNVLDQPSSEREEALRAYRDGRLAERAGQHAEAARFYETVIGVDRSATEPWNRLHHCLVESLGPAAGDARLRDLLRSGALPSRVVEGALRPPAPVRVVSGPDTELVVSPFEPVDPRSVLLASEWEMREVEAGSYVRRPTLRLFREEDPTQLVIPRGQLEAGKVYGWRARYLTAAGASTPWSDEQRLEVPPTASIAVPLDLSAVLDRDVVFDPGDADNDWFDEPNAFSLVIDGFDGRRTDVPSVQGLPADGRLGVFRLAPYDGANARAFEAGRGEPLRIDVPPDRYDCVRLLMGTANGTFGLRLAVAYEEGPSERCAVIAPDWFEVPRPQDVGCGMPGVVVIDRMDRMGAGGIEQRDEARLFESFVPCDPARRVTGIVLFPGESQASSARARTHVFAVTAMRCGS